MSAEVKKEIQLEIAYVLFIDLVGYSKLLVNEQRSRLEMLNEIVRGTDEFRSAEANGRLLTIATGDGMALVFYQSPEAPVECALEVSRALQKHPELQLRMGVHSGPVSGVVDVTGRANVAGAGINMAQRVMDCGDAGHILLSKHVAEDLEQYGHWNPHLHDLGQCEVKHGVRVHVVNLYTPDLGNPAVPEKLRVSQRDAAKKNMARWATVGTAVLVLGGLTIVFLVLRTVDERKRKLGTTLSGGQANHALPIPEKSIAVLPFQSLSKDEENAFFADGVQDEILTDLAKIADLKVISRTSVMQYKNASARNLREIAQQLGVAHVLEGSVQRAAQRVRINAQLIDARTDAHLWGNTYDRELADVFAIQSEIAQAIAQQLQARLSPIENAAIAKAPTRMSSLTTFMSGPRGWRKRPMILGQNPVCWRRCAYCRRPSRAIRNFFSRIACWHARTLIFTGAGSIIPTRGASWRTTYCKPPNEFSLVQARFIRSARIISTTAFAITNKRGANSTSHGKRCRMRPASIFKSARSIGDRRDGRKRFEISIARSNWIRGIW